MDIYKCPKLILPKKSWEKIKFTYILFEIGVITSPKTDSNSHDYRGCKIQVISLFCHIHKKMMLVVGTNYCLFLPKYFLFVFSSNQMLVKIF